MLVITRHPEQRIVIGKNIVITVLGTRGRKVRIGIEAPRDVDVHREEVFQRMTLEELEEEEEMEDD